MSEVITIEPAELKLLISTAVEQAVAKAVPKAVQAAMSGSGDFQWDDADGIIQRFKAGGLCKVTKFKLENDRRTERLVIGRHYRIITAGASSSRGNRYLYNFQKCLEFYS